MNSSLLREITNMRIIKDIIEFYVITISNKNNEKHYFYEVNSS